MAEGNSSQTGKFCSRIPRLQRSVSFHGKEYKSTTSNEATEEELTEALDDLRSLSSVSSVASCAVSSRSYGRAVESAFEIQKTNSPRFTLHCSTPPNNGFPGEYLTPTQRANRTIRQLKSLLKESKTDSNYKDFEIQRLTRELVLLRLEHAQCGKDTVRGEKEPDNSLPLAAPSLADSGHFDDLSYQANQLKDSLVEKEVDSLATGSWIMERSRIANFHTEKMDDLLRRHAHEIQQVRSRFTDRLEAALTQLSDSNTRYANLLTSHDLSRQELEQNTKEQLRLRQKIESLEQKLAQLQIDMEDRETMEYETREKELSQMENLSAELACKNQIILDLQSTLERLSAAADEARTGTQNLQAVASTLEQQQVELGSSSSQNCAIVNDKPRINNANHPSPDPSVMLKFLRSAIFYLLTDSENGAEHLRAIQSILEFSTEERCAVERMGRLGYL
ncbi:protein quick-to-court-like isoform X1 [Daphnia carinata]|uniref:protein quick-to-court-like isoform X1 n=1 Tax=Daphnia carinata TaxID=120202 RepID=UPI00257D6971|nr:protein quick-to-court-like isoform X1 [Daphnia carinata]